MTRMANVTNAILLQESRKSIDRVLDRLVGEFTVEHLVAAENWNDRFECLKWAVENIATVAEMKAWHRAQNGLDLFPEDEGNHTC